MTEPAVKTNRVIRLKHGRDRRVLAGHAWIFSNEIAEADAKASAGIGDVVSVVSGAGKIIGTGFFHPHSLIAVRLLAREPMEINAAFFRRRLERAQAARERSLPGAQAYRLCFGESDGLPGLVIDRYGDVLVLQVYCAGIERRIEVIRGVLEEFFQPKGIYLKNDHRSRTLEGLECGCSVLCGDVPERVEIEEGGLRFHVPIREGQKTGFYFDQRGNREFLRGFYKDRRVLDLHCYVGAFSIGAAKSGAKAVLGVDSSAAAVELAKENAGLNGVEVEFREGDADEALTAFSEGSKEERPDMILLDPPSMAPSKKNLPQALRALARLNGKALKTLTKGGLLVSSTCSHHITREMFVEVLRSAQTRAGRSTRLAALRGQACDHPVLLSMPETEYLHFALLEVL